MKPNILWIMTDQQYAGAMSCAGNDELHTPVMDRIAASGVLFDKAYCTYPICIPSRESMLTGRMPHEIGYHQWKDKMDERFKPEELGTWFQQAGYKCVYGGKLHAPGRDATEHGFEQICGHDDHRLSEACVSFLQQKQERPFLMVASFDNPHNICEWARHEKLPWGNIEEAHPEDCPSLPANYAIPPYEPEVIRMIQQGSPRVYLPANNNDDQWRQYRHAYYRLIEKVDQEIGKILDVLEETGLVDNTLIVFTSDHGDGHGAHQWNQKSVLYEECIRIPLIVSFKGKTRSGEVNQEHLVSNGLDLFPTFCDFADITAPDNLAGKSLRPLVEKGEAQPWRDKLVVETWPFQGDPAPRGTLGRMMRTNKYKYTVYSWGRYREILIDLENDPGEMVNLAVHTKYKDISEQFRFDLQEWCMETKDSQFIRHIPV